MNGGEIIARVLQKAGGNSYSLSAWTHLTHFVEAKPRHPVIDTRMKRMQFLAADAVSRSRSSGVAAVTAGPG